MSPAQYAAILEIAENGERFAPRDLNVACRTIASLARRGWITIENKRAAVTPAGWLAVERDAIRK